KQYRTNGIERDHGFLKERLRPVPRSEVHLVSGDLHARSRVDAQHPPWLLRGSRRSSAATCLCVDLEPARRTCLSCSATSTTVHPRVVPATTCHYPTRMQENRAACPTISPSCDCATRSTSRRNQPGSEALARNNPRRPRCGRAAGTGPCPCPSPAAVRPTR